MVMKDQAEIYTASRFHCPIDSCHPVCYGAHCVQMHADRPTLSAVHEEYNYCILLYGLRNRLNNILFVLM